MEQRICSSQFGRILPTTDLIPSERECSPVGLVGACLATSDRISGTGSDIVSKCVLRSCVCFCIISGHTIMVWKGRRNPKHTAIISYLRYYLSPLSLLSGREPCGDRILQSCLQKAPATAHSNYSCGWKECTHHLFVAQHDSHFYHDAFAEVWGPGLVVTAPEEPKPSQSDPKLKAEPGHPPQSQEQWSQYVTHHLHTVFTLLTEQLRANSTKNRNLDSRSVGLRNQSSKEISGKLRLFRNCGLLFWLVHGQHHVHYESKCERIIGSNLLPFPLQKQKWEKISRFSFVIVSVQIVVLFKAQLRFFHISLVLLFFASFARLAIESQNRHLSGPLSRVLGFNLVRYPLQRDTLKTPE